MMRLRQRCLRRLEEDWEDDDNEAIETGDLLARLVVNELLSDEDTERELEEPADPSDG